MKSVKEQQELRLKWLDENKKKGAAPPPPQDKTPWNRKPVANPGSSKDDFEKDRLALKGLDLPGKLKGRRELLAKYAVQIQNWIESGSKESFPPFAYGVQWQFDLNEFDLYFDWIEIALQRETVPLHSSKKTSFLPCMVYDILEWAEENHSQHKSSEPYLKRMIRLVEKFGGWKATAKKQESQAYYLAFHDLDRQGDVAETLDFGINALVIHKAAIKTRIKDIFKEHFTKDEAKSFIVLLDGAIERSDGKVLQEALKDFLKRKK
ncbi:MAG: phage terminase small subunit [Deltaproteobacteria bacterium]|nr:phage terminase small subunit [Deltaproteobacteria bacterium]